MSAKGPRAQRRKTQREQNKKYRPHAAALGLIVVALLVSSLYPARTLVSRRQRVAALRGESAALDRKIAELRARRDALQTDEEVERIAREELGMIRPGETAFAVLPAASPQPRPHVPEAATVDPPQAESAFSRWWTAFSHSFRIAR
ncbi:MAG: septum formation initiator family protein [Actinobacteria bacterium]|nr:septum formation initiator family protein [Actinomycetota bacterium]